MAVEDADPETEEDAVTERPVAPTPPPAATVPGPPPTPDGEPDFDPDYGADEEETVRPAPPEAGAQPPGPPLAPTATPPPPLQPRPSAQPIRRPPGPRTPAPGLDADPTTLMPTLRPGATIIPDEDFMDDLDADATVMMRRPQRKPDDDGSSR